MAKGPPGWSFCEELQTLRNDFSSQCAEDVPGIMTAKTYAERVLGVMRSVLNGKAVEGRWFAAAVGGFGRGELSFFSDLDILFLHRGRMPKGLEELIRGFVYGLWDGAFEVGHTATSVSGLRRLASDDFSAETTYLEARFMGGDRRFFESWRRSHLKAYSKRRRFRFLDSVQAYRRVRLKEYGETSYLLEPHVKEGIGGLRDLHVIRWLGYVFLGDPNMEAMVRRGWVSKEEARWLEKAHDFLWRVRLQLHRIARRRQDRLLLDEQETVGSRLGFLPGAHGKAVEAFMRLYYTHTGRIRRVTDFLMERLQQERTMSRRRFRRRTILTGPLVVEGEHILFAEPEMVPDRPAILMELFWNAARKKTHFHHETGRVVRENLKHFSDEDRKDPRVVARFFDILLNGEMAFPTLTMMMETGFLQTFIPEFAPVRYRVQHDVYHLYTVDEHCLRAVLELHRLESGEEIIEAGGSVAHLFRDLPHRRILFLAALLHDLGKGQRRNHAVRGAAMALEIAERFRLNEEETHLLHYLILNHLLLAETALKRDLSDEKPVMLCAMQVPDRTWLRMLYLLTIADSRATGPGAWNTWRASLLHELFVKVDHILRQGDGSVQDMAQRLERVQRDLVARVADPEERHRFVSWMKGLSPRYLLSQSPEDVLHHYELEGRLEKSNVVVSAKPAQGEMWQIVVACRDKPGLFSLITGVLWLHGLNILSADLFTRQRGVALDILTIEDLPDPLHADSLWDRVREELAEVIEDPSKLDWRIRKGDFSRIVPRKPFRAREDRVVIDEHASDFYSVIEVYSWDRPGLLHAVSRTLYELGLTIQLAKISTPGAQVVDVFYVTDLEGNKLMDPEKHRHVRETLLRCLQKV